MLAAVTWLQAFLFLGTAVVIFPQAGANEIAEIRLVVVAVGSAVLIGTMLARIEALRAGAFFGPLLRLMLEIGAGAAAYAASMALMWLALGRPEGAEAYLLKNILHIRRQSKE